MFVVCMTTEDNIFYEQFLQWLQDASNHELFVRVKQFVTKINDIVPKLLPQEREMQSVCFLRSNPQDRDDRSRYQNVRKRSSLRNGDVGGAEKEMHTMSAKVHHDHVLQQGMIDVAIESRSSPACLDTNPKKGTSFWIDVMHSRSSSRLRTWDTTIDIRFHSTRNSGIARLNVCLVRRCEQ